MNKYFLLEKKYHKLAIPSLKAFYNKDDAEAALSKARENPNLSWASIGAVQDYDASIDKDNQIAELQKKLTASEKHVATLETVSNNKTISRNAEVKLLIDKLHRRNMMIKDLQKQSVKPNSVATVILATAIKWLQNQEVDNPFKGCQGIDCGEIEKAIQAVNKVVSL